MGCDVKDWWVINLLDSLFSSGHSHKLTCFPTLLIEYRLNGDDLPFGTRQRSDRLAVGGGTHVEFRVPEHQSCLLMGLLSTRSCLSKVDIFRVADQYDVRVVDHVSTIGCWNCFQVDLIVYAIRREIDGRNLAYLLDDGLPKDTIRNLVREFAHDRVAIIGEEACFHARAIAQNYGLGLFELRLQVQGGINH